MAMENQLQLQTITMKAGADLSGYQYRFVRISGAFVVKTQSARGAIAGVLQNKPDAQNKPARVVISGIGKLKTDGGVSAMEFLMSDASGLADTATLGTGTGVNIGAWALENDGGSGSVIRAVIGRQGIQL